jgi:branched-chain amino acid transport system permease protein
VFIVLAASYDMLIGYAGIVSFAHTMFFGLGAYGAAIALKGHGGSWSAAFAGSAAGLALSLALAFLVGVLSLRVKAIFFAMVTLAVASLAQVLVSQFSAYTGGEDGIVYSAPISPADILIAGADGKAAKWFGVALTGRIAAYYFVLASCAVLFFTLWRLVRSPFGSVLAAIRENEMRAEAIGYRVVAYRTAAFAISAAAASLAGSVWAIWLRYCGPDATLSFAIMIDILLMVVIGGMGTMIGVVIGVTLMSLAQYYLKDLMQLAADATVGIPLLPHLLEPDRWLLWLGVLFILLVYFFPAGIAGTLMARSGRR